MDSFVLTGFCQIQFRRQCPSRGADPAFAFGWWQLSERVNLALEALVNGSPGGVGLVLAGHRTGPPGVGREPRAKAALLGGHAAPSDCLVLP
jgi:hypothetical protein